MTIRERWDAVVAAQHRAAAELDVQPLTGDGSHEMARIYNTAWELIDDFEASDDDRRHIDHKERASARRVVHASEQNWTKRKMRSDAAAALTRIRSLAAKMDAANFPRMETWQLHRLIKAASLLAEVDEVGLPPRR